MKIKLAYFCVWIVCVCSTLALVNYFYLQYVAIDFQSYRFLGYNGNPPGPASNTRYGNELKYDERDCPTGSLMPKRGQLPPPMTDKCPTLFVIGAKKGGTKSMYQYTSKHPDFQGVHLTDRQLSAGELWFFSKKPLNEETLAYYLSQFPNSTMTGEATVDYFVHCESPAKIFRACGEKAKAIILLREPVSRYVSNFMMRVISKDYIYRSYRNETSIITETQIELQKFYKGLSDGTVNITDMDIRISWENFTCMWGSCESMIYEGLYYVFIRNWLCNFPPENIMIIDTNQFRTNTTMIMREVFHFLGLKQLNGSEMETIVNHTYNKGIKQQKHHHLLTNELKRTLATLYKPFNDAVLELLNWKDPFSWKL